MLQEFLEFLDSETCVTKDAAHREFVDRVVARDRENAAPVTHYDVFTLVDDFEAGLFESPNSSEMIYARELRHDYAGTSTSRTVEPFEILTAASRYSRIASCMFSKASSSVLP